MLKTIFSAFRLRLYHAHTKKKKFTKLIAIHINYAILYRHQLLFLGNCCGYAPVAQLDRALDSDSKGRWFESSRAHHVAASGLPFAAIFLKSPRAHLAAAPFQIEPASPDFDLVSGANLWKLILTAYCNENPHELCCSCGFFLRLGTFGPIMNPGLYP